MIKTPAHQILMTVLIVLGMLASCKTQSKYGLQNLPANYITYGSYGGFSGNITTHFFFPNGQIFTTQSISNDSAELSPIKPGQAKKLFRMLDKSDFLKTNENAPGNMSYFLSTFHDNTKTYRVLWGQGGSTPPEAIQNITKKLDAILLEKRPQTLDMPN